ncbi:MAG: tetratricopeptide repeat protein [Paraglaciecola sp.]|uniref:tetratricopeptide repeat protein n=1 Tax=Paraglaciecola sp. TaxID=1920173 RepID=UPI003297571F
MSVKKCLIFIFLMFNINIASAEIVPEEVDVICGVRSCDAVFKKMKRFAKNGSPHAQAILSLLYRGGYGTEINHKLSVKYMKKAAKGDLAFAQYDLGLLYKVGYNVKKDLAESDKWLRKSAESGNKKAIDLLRSENKLSDDEYLAFKNSPHWPKADDEVEVITVTREKYTLSDLVDFLSSLGYARNSNTGSRIRGKGCGSSGTSCAKLQVNSPLGKVQFAKILGTLNGIETGALMKSLGQTK